MCGKETRWDQFLVQDKVIQDISTVATAIAKNFSAHCFLFYKHHEGTLSHFTGLQPLQSPTAEICPNNCGHVPSSLGSSVILERLRWSNHQQTFSFTSQQKKISLPIVHEQGAGSAETEEMPCCTWTSQLPLSMQNRLVSSVPAWVLSKLYLGFTA